MAASHGVEVAFSLRIKCLELGGRRTWVGTSESLGVTVHFLKSAICNSAKSRRWGRHAGLDKQEAVSDQGEW